MDLSLTFLGTSASAPTSRRGLAGLVVRRGGDWLLFDCGEGTQRQMIRSVGLADLEHIFITHFHADHFLGLPGMLKTFSLRGREAPLTIYGPPGLYDLFEKLDMVLGGTKYRVSLVELEPNEAVRFGDYEVVAFPVQHGVRAYGYALVEDDRAGRFDEEEAVRLGVKPGPDFGRLQRGETVDVADGTVNPVQVLGETRLGRKLVYSGDTSPCEALRIAAHEADVLVHEASFLDDERARAAETHHSTAAQAAQIGKDAQVKLLCLTHISGRYFAKDVREEARAVFEQTVVPHDFDTVEVPLPERGQPHLLKREKSSDE
ncbi:MAG: ribonuclease Z [Thermoleophilaceae bacterium]|nr:ribonuclease Z [Thermoleophilaceae bacterium]